MKKTILGIETSCDDTSLAIIQGTGLDILQPPLILAHQSFGQDLILKKWGGVVPEIAARNHVEKILPLLKSCLEEAQISLAEVDLIGVTTRPGLMGPLLTGLNAAKTISLNYSLPIFGVNHLYAHLEAIHLTENISYPYLGLLVSGGHSAYYLVQDSQTFTLIGSTLDDAAGEVFDKGGKLLGLGYPAGRIIDSLGSKGDPTRYNFPIGLRDSGNAQLSFSGVKTSLRLFLEKNPQFLALTNNQSKDFETSQVFWDLCASYQEAIVKALQLKLKWALKMANIPHLPVVVGGGVACNQRLRQKLTEEYPHISFVAPRFCTDNGAMVANYTYRNWTKAQNFPQCLAIEVLGSGHESV